MVSPHIFQVTEGEWSFEKLVDVLGLKMPAYFTSDPRLLCDFFENFQTRPDDIFVVTYPKSVPWDFWNDHVLDWWKHKDDPDVLFLKYEDLQKDLLSHVRMIANFLNKPLSDDLISRIAEQCTFSEMNKTSASYVMKNEKGETSLLRRGVVGDWKNYFTPELNERFDKDVLAKLKWIRV